MNNPTFWNNKENADTVINKITNLKNIINPIVEVQAKINNNLETLELLTNQLDNELINIIEEEYQKLLEETEKLKIQTYLSGEYDKNNCILEIHAGAGGTESCDWANMLYRMYTRYCKKQGYITEEIDSQPGEEVGLKSVMMMVKGTNAYGYLKNEKGVHRLVRISPFDSNKRRHTSFASVEVTPEIDKNISIDINETDLKIDIYRSSGPGGQGVNTTDSAVRITHLPTGIVVTCQNERSQIQNKEHCLEILKSKLYAKELEKQNEKLNNMKSDQKEIAFGSGKRSYVMCPYTQVKDNDTQYVTSKAEEVLDGNIDNFIIEGLKNKKE
jgi:peptide chain release factor 2